MIVNNRLFASCRYAGRSAVVGAAVVVSCRCGDYIVAGGSTVAVVVIPFAIAILHLNVYAIIIRFVAVVMGGRVHVG